MVVELYNYDLTFDDLTVPFSILFTSLVARSSNRNISRWNRMDHFSSRGLVKVKNGTLLTKGYINVFIKMILAP